MRRRHHARAASSRFDTGTSLPAALPITIIRDRYQIGGYSLMSGQYARKSPDQGLTMLMAECHQ